MRTSVFLAMAAMAVMILASAAGAKTVKSEEAAWDQVKGPCSAEAEPAASSGESGLHREVESLKHIFPSRAEMAPTRTWPCRSRHSVTGSGSSRISRRRRGDSAPRASSIHVWGDPNRDCIRECGESPGGHDHRVFYADGQYHGASFTLYYGESARNLCQNGWNDRISSMKAVD